MSSKRELEAFKKHFPIFREYEDLSYLDNAATTQKPQVVIDAAVDLLRSASGNPHRGAHKLSVKATEIYESARREVAEFLHVKNADEIIFTAGTTESINLIASSIPMNMAEGKERIVISITSHHSNLLPWQRLSKRLGLKLDYIYLKDGVWDTEDFSKLDEKTLLFAFPLVANATGLVHDYKEAMSLCKEKGIITVIDGAQAVGHHDVDVDSLGGDFFVYSGHKAFSGTGIGVLHGRKSLLEMLQPFYLGGDMIEYVTEQDATYAPIPQKFEAGTQNTLGAATLLAATRFIRSIGLDTISEREQLLYDYAYDELEKLSDFIEIVSIRQKGTGIISFNVKEVHPHDVASILDGCDVAIRAGHHCAQPLMKYLGLYSTCRISFALYNDYDDIDQLIRGLMKVKEVFFSG